MLSSLHAGLWYVILDVNDDLLSYGSMVNYDDSTRKKRIILLFPFP